MVTFNPLRLTHQNYDYRWYSWLPIIQQLLQDVLKLCLGGIMLWWIGKIWRKRWLTLLTILRSPWRNMSKVRIGSITLQRTIGGPVNEKEEGSFWKSVYNPVGLCRRILGILYGIPGSRRSLSEHCGGGITNRKPHEIITEPLVQHGFWMYCLG